MKYKKIVLYVAIAACLLSWIGVGVGFMMDMERNVAIGLVTTAAITTEALFWAVAFVFGMSVYESRRKIGVWVKARLGIGKREST